ncbi:MAG: hypothetical protein KAG10_01625 [Methylococcales bacterium]|nr:hypothetical protein [Methylococcales bacterium]MCK5924573.1 hypothetical protein [Methylococcales bacterium]
MLSCQKIIELASTHLNNKLPFRHKMELSVHLLMCTTCKCYVQQLKVLQKFAKNIDQHSSNITLSTKARERIQKKLR